MAPRIDPRRALTVRFGLAARSVRGKTRPSRVLCVLDAAGAGGREAFAAALTGTKPIVECCPLIRPTRWSTAVRTCSGRVCVCARVCAHARECARVTLRSNTIAHHLVHLVVLARRHRHLHHQARQPADPAIYSSALVACSPWTACSSPSARRAPHWTRNKTAHHALLAAGPVPPQTGQCHPSRASATPVQTKHHARGDRRGGTGPATTAAQARPAHARARSALHTHTPRAKRARAQSDGSARASASERPPT